MSVQNSWFYIKQTGHKKDLNIQIHCALKKKKSLTTVFQVNSWPKTKKQKKCMWFAQTYERKQKPVTEHTRKYYFTLKLHHNCTTLSSFENIFTHTNFLWSCAALQSQKQCNANEGGVVPLWFDLRKDLPPLLESSHQALLTQLLFAISVSKQQLDRNKFTMFSNQRIKVEEEM